METNRFQHEQSFGSAMNQHAVSFPSSVMMDSTSEMIMMGNYFGMNRSAGGMIFPGNSSSNPGSSVTQTNSLSSILLDPVPGLKHDAGLAVEWSVEEQYMLEEGLVKYADDPSIMRYIKIAAMFHDKTVRDVALRCRWMMDKFVESSSKACMPSVTPLNMAAYSVMTNHQSGNDPMSCEALDGAKRLLEQNNEALGRISANLSILKLQDNIDLFCHTRNNISAILNDMRNMPGIMSQMPALPLSLNEELANRILPSTSQTTMFGLPSGVHLKQELRR